MRLQPWAEAAPAEIRAIFSAEAERWRAGLAWDTSALWATIEHARTSGRLPGLVARDDAGALTGWTYYLVRDGELHCGALSARSSDETAVLVDAVLRSPEAVAAARVVLFAFSEAPGLEAVLRARGFVLGPYDYLQTTLAGRVAGRPAPGRHWDLRDLDSTAELLRTSYPANEPGRPFAPHGRPRQWRQYAAELVMGQGCGRFRSSLSIAVPDDDGALEAMALVTDIGDGTAHLAQLAVRPDLRGAGLGGRLVAAVADRAAAAGFERLTLLVGDANIRAHRLYARAGFSRVARFVCAARSGAASSHPDRSGPTVAASAA